jgi:hypothetical protein
MTHTTIPAEPTADTLERLYHRVAELEADLRVINSNIEYLERVVLGKRPSGALREPEDNWKDISEHVKEELFNYHLNTPREDDE